MPTCEEAAFLFSGWTHLLSHGNAQQVKRFVITLSFAASLSAQEEPPQLDPPTPARVLPPAPQPKAPSLIAVARDEAAIQGFDENPAATRRMVEQLVKSATGCATTAEAWRSLVAPSDRVGIKVSTAGGRYFSTRRGVVVAVVDGLKMAGVPGKNIFVWDRDAVALREAGFTEERLGCTVRGIDQPKGWDREDALVAPVLGELIWGDLQFTERVVALDRTDGDQLSSKSHVCKILSRDATKWINIPALSDAPGLGVHGAFYSAVVANVDNWRRFTTAGPGGALALPDMFADPRIGGKCALHILDALMITFAGGPGPNPQYAAKHSTLYASKDPVALDATGVRLIDQLRLSVNLPILGPKSTWLQSAETVGNFAESMIRFSTAK